MVTKKEISDDFEEKFSYALNLRFTDLAEAYLALLRLFEENPESAPLLAALGIVCREQRQYHEAAGYFKRLTILKPKSERGSLGLFHSLWDLDLREEALEEMKRFLSISKSEEYEEILSGIMVAIEEDESEVQDIPSSLPGQTS
jgi:tetratricopeptide (TPR) repeat protein